MKGKKGGKYAAELAKIKELKALDTILKKGDIENALLTNAAKESEPVSENVIDAILNSAEKGKIGERDMELIEKLTTKKGNAKTRKAVHAHHKAKKRAKARWRPFHARKRNKPKVKKHRAKKRRR